VEVVVVEMDEDEKDCSLRNHFGQQNANEEEIKIEIKSSFNPKDVASS
jgi:hypothetical protein